MKKNFAIYGALVLSIIVLARCAPQKYPDGLYAEVQTNKGLIVLQLEFEKTPMTAANFVGLAEGTIVNAAFPEGVPYFDGTKWHRVVPGHVIQCGIPKSDKAKDPGYQFPNEIVLPDLNHGRAGMVNMANGGPHTNGSQWCITLGDRSYLDGDYTVFGHVVEGMDAVFKIVQDDEIQTVKIVRVGKAAKKFHPTTESFQKMLEEAKARVKDAEARRKADEDALILKNWPNAIAGEAGLKYVILREGRGMPPAAGEKIKVLFGKMPAQRESVRRHGRGRHALLGRRGRAVRLRNRENEDQPRLGRDARLDEEGRETSCDRSRRNGIQDERFLCQTAPERETLRHLSKHAPRV